MDRRIFLLGIGASVVSFSLGGCAWHSQQSYHTAGYSASLKAQLADLADPRFLEYAQNLSVQTLYTKLELNGVISATEGINYKKLSTLARQEPMVIYQGFYYTQTELDLYALAHLISKT